MLIVIDESLVSHYGVTLQARISNQFLNNALRAILSKVIITVATAKIFISGMFEDRA